MMLELRELKEVENRDNVLYLHFSKLPVAHTKSYADGEINVDLDHYGEVVGIEVLSLGPDELSALSAIVSKYRLSLDLLTHANKK